MNLFYNSKHIYERQHIKTTMSWWKNYWPCRLNLYHLDIPRSRSLQKHSFISSQFSLALWMLNETDRNCLNFNPHEFSEKPKGYSQQITDFRKSVSHRKFYTPIQQLITDNPFWVLTVSSPLPPPFLPTSYLLSPSIPTTILYKTYYYRERNTNIFL